MPTKKQNRFATIDGFRGLAALGVVLYHFYGSLKPALDNALPSFITTLFSYGYLGVPIFFVISGFVISHTVGRTTITRKYFGNFILRRSIRLDFTYWASILLAIILLLGKNLYLNADEPIPSMGNVLIHMFYLQDITQIHPLISV
ncbi:acyltransferase family protein, partial [Oleiphilus sp. HI0079]